jgi:hypothetical protein
MSTDTTLQHDTPDLPAEFYLDGPVPDGEELLRRTVAAVHKRSARSARLRVSLFVVAALVACAALAGTGLAVGRLIGGPHVSIAESYYSATDPGTGAKLAATVTPGEGGSHLTVTVTGLPQGTPCQLTVIGTNGTRVPGGGWRIPQDRKPVTANVWMAPDQMAEIEVAAGPLDLVVHTR